ncbi:MAG: extracellular solute-binding protein [Treponema sp.]|nr:extracellular solute-binding protein [Treponema sp.]
MKELKGLGLGLTLGLCVTLTAAFAGGGRQTSGTVAADGLTTLRFWGRNAEYVSSQGQEHVTLQDQYEGKVPSRLWDTFVKKLADMGIKPELTLVMDDQYQTAFQTLRASGQFNNYDLVYGHGLGLQTLYSLVDQGRIVALNQAVEQYSDGTAKTFFGSGNGAKLKDLFTMTDGNFYWIPGMYQLTYKGTPMGGITLGVIRKDWLDTLGLPMPKTADELYNAFYQFQEKDINRNGIKDEVASVDIASFNNGLAQLFGIATDHEGEGLHYLANVMGTLQCAWYQSGIKDYFAFMNRLYKAGLLRTGGEPTDQAENKIGYQNTWFPNNDELIINVPAGDKGAYYVPLLFSAVPGTQPPIWNVGGLSIGTDKVMMIPSASKKIDTAVKFIDWDVTNDFFTLMEPGIEGYTFNYDENGIPVRFQNSNQIGVDGLRTVSFWAEALVPWVQIRDSYGGVVSTVNQGKEVGYPGGWTEKLDFMNNLVANSPYPYSWYTGGVLAQATLQEQDRLTAILPDLNTYISELCSALVMGEKGLDNASWNGYIDNLKRLGLDEIISIWQTRINRVSGK